ncbi:MAG: carbamoyltransferase HypF [Armatimonadetes bacterium]|nr:carbamoyltransferase HypF [Armatimonadota bacterium]
MRKKRYRYRVNGTVQGVGFRPFVYRLAHRFNLVGFIINDSFGVLIEVEGSPKDLSNFAKALKEELPPLAKITTITKRTVQTQQEPTFTIKKSLYLKGRKAIITPDAAICKDCLRELFEPKDRRFRYPFINCTNCGPRHTIILDIPYDRPNTTMNTFKMCKTCQAEYDNPLSRRFHAQPNACWDCGPRLSFCDKLSAKLDVNDPIKATVRALKEGKIVAIKGLGGYHLACDATNSDAVATLRKRKHREEKPLAIMSRDVETVQKYAYVSSAEKRLLESVQRPICLLRKKKTSLIAEEVAPNNKYLGVMLCYSPVHYLIFENDFLALVMTSANISEEPIAKDEDDAFERLAGIADYFLTNNRPIYTRSDDSVARVFLGKPAILRRSRGYVPFPTILERKFNKRVLAVGAELKNTICLTKDENAYVSQHIGDLKNMRAWNFFTETIEYLKKILEIEPEIVAYDFHPAYLSSQFAETLALPKMQLQHHFAHIVSVLAENNLFDEQVIGLACDGTGFGIDGTIWGGEFLIASCSEFARVGHLKYFPLPGGDKAIEHPPRSAYSYLYKILGKEKLDKLELPFLSALPEKMKKNLAIMIERGINSPLTSSLGRLFDVASSILGICQKNTYEGQAPVMLENVASENENASYDFDIVKQADEFIIDPSEILKGMIHDIQKGISTSKTSARFHNSVAEFLKKGAITVRNKTGINKVALSGGVFQNNYLLNGLFRLLKREGFEVLFHKTLPPNDGCISFGQAVACDMILRNS